MVIWLLSEARIGNGTERDTYTRIIFTLNYALNNILRVCAIVYWHKNVYIKIVYGHTGKDI